MGTKTTKPTPWPHGQPDLPWGWRWVWANSILVNLGVQKSVNWDLDLWEVNGVFLQHLANRDIKVGYHRKEDTKGFTVDPHVKG